DVFSAKSEKLAALLSKSGKGLPELQAAFADLLGLPAGDRHPSLPNDPREKRERILSALVHHLEDLARQRPVLLLFEDVHWSDSTTLDLLERLAERIRKLPVLMVMTFRPEFEPVWAGQAQVTSMILNRLSQRETLALAGGVAGGKSLPGEISDRIIAHTDGIPLCIEELTRALLESNLLREESEKIIVSGPMPARAIPWSLHDSLMARLDRLGPVKEVAQIGAAIGREFTYDILKAATGRPDDRLGGELDQLVEAGLIFKRGGPQEPSFVFKHALVQDAAYGTLLRGRRQELHAKIAKALEE